MAEAAVENPSHRFYCHECNREVQPNIESYTCSRCNSGFIEEMERPATPRPGDSRSSDPAAQFAEVRGRLVRLSLGTLNPDVMNVKL
ncbi:E3 ubiquitin-protein ligase RNF115-like [Elysia marginata]|uniref:RING-type E3 ubiquitin transferase n=1 Tax=Elysia marginata TaxID=1093978 RepID=A0AAV4GE62_9GAST|nr:E3 ubiquitin-protein ligase RNF115-like [Elysia marginata]